jgi:hypothetical protein
MTIGSAMVPASAVSAIGTECDRSERVDALTFRVGSGGWDGKGGKGVGIAVL